MKADIVTLGKLVQTSSPMAVIVISPYFIAQEGLNYLYSYLAISNIVYSIYNYGNNGKLSFYYRSLGNKKKFIHIGLIEKRGREAKKEQMLTRTCRRFDQ